MPDILPEFPGIQRIRERAPTSSAPSMHRANLSPPDPYHDHRSVARSSRTGTSTSPGSTRGGESHTFTRRDKDPFKGMPWGDQPSPATRKLATQTYERQAPQFRAEKTIVNGDHSLQMVRANTRHQQDRATTYTGSAAPSRDLVRADSHQQTTWSRYPGGDTNAQQAGTVNAPSSWYPTHPAPPPINPAYAPPSNMGAGQFHARNHQQRLPVATQAQGSSYLAMTPAPTTYIRNQTNYIFINECENCPKHPEGPVIPWKYM